MITDERLLCSFNAAMDRIISVLRRSVYVCIHCMCTCIVTIKLKLGWSQIERATYGISTLYLRAIFVSLSETSD